MIMYGFVKNHLGQNQFFKIISLFFSSLSSVYRLIH